MEQIQKNLRFSKNIIDVLEPKAKKLGFTFNDFVKYLVTKEAEKEIESIEYINDPELIKAVKEAEEDHAAGRLKTLSSPQEMNNYFKNLLLGED